MWFTGMNYYKLAVEKDRDSIFTTITAIWKRGFKKAINIPMLMQFNCSARAHHMSPILFSIQQCENRSFLKNVLPARFPEIFNKKYYDKQRTIQHTARTK
jgi:hypothetical protein